MLVDTFNIYTYEVPFKKPFFVKDLELTKRKGIILHLQIDKYEGFGEIAPLENFSTESFEEALEQTIALKTHILNDEIPKHVEKLDGRLNKWLEKYKLMPSVQFGIETAILNLITSTRNIPLYKLITESFEEEIFISGLLQGSKEEILKQASEMINQGFKSLKLKVSNSIEEDIEKVNSLHDIITGKALLHIDANQKWEIDQAMIFGNHVNFTDIDYIEEPFSKIEDISNFYNKTLIPVALDETLQKKSFNDIKSIDGVDVVILKPTMIGGIDKTWEIIKEGKRLAIRAIISSSFETSIGVLALANLAGAIDHNKFSGLDTLKYFEEDLLKDPITIEHGKINIKDRTITTNDINFQKLTKVKA